MIADCVGSVTVGFSGPSERDTESGDAAFRANLSAACRCSSSRAASSRTFFGSGRAPRSCRRTAVRCNDVDIDIAKAGSSERPTALWVFHEIPTRHRVLFGLPRSPLREGKRWDHDKLVFSRFRHIQKFCLRIATFPFRTCLRTMAASRTK